jgi:hypothetical protein
MLLDVVIVFNACRIVHILSVDSYLNCKCSFIVINLVVGCF